jgi:aminopeptidase N
MHKLIGSLSLVLFPLLTLAQSVEKLKSFYENDAQKKTKLLQQQGLAEALVTPNQEMYDVHFYSLDFEIIPEEKKISGKVVIAAQALAALDRMELDFINNHEVHGVYLAEYPDSVLEFQHSAGIIDIQLDKLYTEGEKINVLLEFTAVRLDWVLYFTKYQGLDMIFSWFGKQWFPCKKTPGDKADSTDMRVTVPDDLVVASNGLLKEICHNDTSSTYFWQERYPIAPYLISFAAYPYEVYKDWYVNASNDSMEIQMFTIPEVYDQVKDFYAKEKEMLAFYEDQFGPYPFFNEKYGHSEVYLSVSEEFQTMTSISISNLLADNAEILIAHELAHSWMGNSVTNESWHHIWIQEGFATYATAMWYEFKEYEEDILNTIMDIFEYYGNGTPYIENPETQDHYNTYLTYHKPAWVYHMLRHMVGDSVFSDIIQAITSDPSCAYGNITTDDFREICEGVSGLNLEKFFQQWIMGERYPNYAYSWKYSEKESGYELELTLEQVQYGQLFWMPVDVSVHTADGVEKFVVWDSLETQVFHMDVIDLPLSVELDPENWVLNKASDITGIEKNPRSEPEILAVPNPFTSTVEFSYTVPSPSHVGLLIFNELGQEVAKLADGFFTSGTHTLSWDAEGNRPGIYFYRIKLGDRVQSGKLVLSE